MIMAFIECNKHSENVAIMTSKKVCDAVDIEDRIILRSDLELFRFALDVDIHFQFWIFKSELSEIQPVIEVGNSPEELEKNEWLLGLMKPCCELCFEEHLTGN